MKFDSPLWLIVLAGLPAVCALAYWRGAVDRERRLARLIAPRLRESLMRSVDGLKRRLKGVLLVVGILLAAFALARPLLPEIESKAQRDGIDIVVALDVSRSMLAADLAPDRLAVAKTGLSNLVARLGGDRLALVPFAGEPYLAVPLTQDHTAFTRTLSALTTESVTKPGSDLAAAIRLGIKTLAVTNRAARPPPRVILLLSDGEQLQGEAIVAAQEARTAGLAILTVGVGTPLGARVPDARAARRDIMLKNEFGRDVVSKLDERTLQQIAASSFGGRYALLGRDAEGLEKLRQSSIEPLAARALTRSEKEFREIFQVPLLVSLAVLLIEMLVNERRRTK